MKPGARPAPHRSTHIASLARVSAFVALLVVSCLLLYWGPPSGPSFTLGNVRRLRFPSSPVCPALGASSASRSSGSGDAAGAQGELSSLRPTSVSQVTKAVIFSTYPPTKCGLATFSLQLREGLLQVRLRLLRLHWMRPRGCD